MSKQFKKLEDIKDMEVGKKITMHEYQITRVPGGWIFYHMVGMTAVFVPIPGL